MYTVEQLEQQMLVNHVGFDEDDVELYKKQYISIIKVTAKYIHAEMLRDWDQTQKDIERVEKRKAFEKEQGDGWRICSDRNSIIRLFKEKDWQDWLLMLGRKESKYQSSEQDFRDVMVQIAKEAEGEFLTGRVYEVLASLATTKHLGTLLKERRERQWAADNYSRAVDFIVRKESAEKQYSKLRENIGRNAAKSRWDDDPKSYAMGKAYNEWLVANKSGNYRAKLARHVLAIDGIKDILVNEKNLAEKFSKWERGEDLPKC